MTINSTLSNKVLELDIKEVMEETIKRVESGEDPQAILDECREGMEGVGYRFENGNYFIADLMFAADIFNQVMEILDSKLKEQVAAKAVGKVLIATVKDDIHDIGKNLVIAMLSASGFEVVDLGVNVLSQDICKAVEQHNPDIVGLSCLLTSCLDSMEEAVGEIRSKSENHIKIIVGGSPVSPDLAEKFGADAYGSDAYQAVIKCQQLLEVK